MSSTKRFPAWVKKNLTTFYLKEISKISYLGKFKIKDKKYISG